MPLITSAHEAERVRTAQDSRRRGEYRWRVGYEVTVIVAAGDQPQVALALLRSRARKE
jgi:hypothetical protein